jgi:Uma2 family endonuclease
MDTSTVLTGVRWETYESLLCDYQDRSAPHFTFDRGTLEIMSPLPWHESRKDLLDLLVDVLAEEQGLDIVSLGSTTFRRADLQRGFEPDACFYIQNIGLLPANLAELDPANLPPPDLVIEIDITHGSLDKLPLYAAFGVAEVWRDDGQRVTALRRYREGYAPSAESIAFPGLTADVLTRFVNLSQVTRRTQWLRQLRAWARGAESETNGHG